MLHLPGMLLRQSRQLDASRLPDVLNTPSLKYCCIMQTILCALCLHAVALQSVTLLGGYEGHQHKVQWTVIRKS